MEKPLEGFYSQQQEAVNKIAPLPDKQCRAVVLSVWEETDETDLSKGAPVDASVETIYYGFGGSPVHPVRAGETTRLIWVSNLNQISVRCSHKKSGGTMVKFSCYK